MQFDIHTHTIASGHGTDCTIADMAKSASARGLKMLGISDHGPATLGAGKPSYFRSLLMSPGYRCGVRVLYGIELNILDTLGTVDLEDDILSRLDYGIASLHTQNHKPGSREENTQSYIAAMAHSNVKMIGHCDDVKYPVDYLALVQAAKEHHVILELNEASLTPGGYRGDTRENDQELLKWCRIYQHPIVLSSDSHGPENIGMFSHCRSLLKAVDFPDKLVLNNSMNDLLDYFHIGR